MAEPAPPGWYQALAAHLGRAYFEYRFTQGTDQEIEFLRRALVLKPGDRLLDVGCGPGRHAVPLALLGVHVVGVDTSAVFLDIARDRAEEAGVGLSLFLMDAAALPFEDEFDAAICLCEGAFGLGLDDLKILRGVARALKPGGHLALSAPNTFYVVNRLQQGDSFDPVGSIFHRTLPEVIGHDGTRAPFETWNSCYTPRELEWIANGAGLDPEFVSGVAPGQFLGQTPTMEHPEILLLARKP
ncbi:MAG: class I SAM-dependent methyltransferase [Actinomycetota bacterium]